MMTQKEARSRGQIHTLSLDELVPPNHLVRKLEAALDWDFIYDLVEDKYSNDIVTTVKKRYTKRHQKNLQKGGFYAKSVSDKPEIFQ